MCEHADFGYENQDAVVDLSITIDPGDYLCIVGANGSGKSTLIKGLLGLLAPTAGTLIVAEELRRGGIGYLPQQTAAQRDFPAITELKKQCYRELSGGQQQRVLIARALCATEQMLILDEPITGLDPSAIQEFYRLIRKLNQRDGITIVMVSHDIRSIIGQANKILHMQQRALFFGPAADYAQSAAGKAFLES